MWRIWDAVLAGCGLEKQRWHTVLVSDICHVIYMSLRSADAVIVSGGLAVMSDRWVSRLKCYNVKRGLSPDERPRFALRKVIFHDAKDNLPRILRTDVMIRQVFCLLRCFTVLMLLSLYCIFKISIPLPNFFI